MNEHQEVVSVIAGGWSFSAVNHDAIPGFVIGVNDALVYWEGKRRPLDAVVSMDRLWTEHRWMDIEKNGLPTFLRRSTLQNVPWQRKPWGWLHTYQCHTEEPLFSPDRKVLNGRNSGAIAVNLAFTLKPKVLFLFGFDMGLSPAGVAHWHPPYPWGKGPKGNTGKMTYALWALDFARYRVQFDEIGTKAYNVSPGSLIGAFEKVSAKEVGCAK